MKLPIKVPPGWNVEPLESLLDLSQSGIWGDPCQGDDGVPVLRSSNIQDGSLVLKDVALRSIQQNDIKRYKLNSGDIIVTKSSGSSHLIGECCIFEQPQNGRPFLFSNFTQRVRPNAVRLDFNFLFFYLNSPFGRALLDRINNTTSGLRNLNMKAYLSQPIPFPPLPIQKKIAAILEKADQARRKRQEALRLTDQFLQAAFLEMFGDPVKNPKGWKIISLEEVSDGNKAAIKCGPFGSQLLISELRHKGIPVYGIDNVGVNEFIWAKPKFITPQKYKELKAFSIYPGDVLISRTGTVGRTCLAPDLIPESIIGPNLLKVTLDKNKLLPVVLSCAINYCPPIIEKIKAMSPGATVAVFNTTNLKALKLPIPPMLEQQKFSVLVEKIIPFREKQCQSKQELDNLFQSLMQRAFRGD